MGDLIEEGAWRVVQITAADRATRGYGWEEIDGEIRIRKWQVLVWAVLESPSGRSRYVSGLTNREVGTMLICSETDQHFLAYAAAGEDELDMEALMGKAVAQRDQMRAEEGNCE